MEYMESMESQPGSQHMVLEQEALSGEVSVSGSVWAEKRSDIRTLSGRFVRVTSTPAMCKAVGSFGVRQQWARSARCARAANA